MLSTITTVLITVVLCLLALFLLLKFGLKYFVGRFVQKMVGAAMNAASQSMPIAPRVTMELEKVKFADPLVNRYMSQFKALGYESSGRYTVPEIPVVQMWTGTHPKDGSLAMVLEVRDTCVSVDVIRFYENGSVMGAGTNPFYHPENYPPHMQYKPFPLGTDAATIVEWFRNRPLESAVLPITHVNLRQVNTRFYALQMDYQLSRPFQSFEDFKRRTLLDMERLGKKPPELNEAQWRTGYEMHRNSVIEALDGALKEHLLQSGKLSARQWEDVQYELHFIHERLMDEDVATRALARSQWSPDHPKVEALLNQGTQPAALFDSIQRLLPEDERYTLLATVDHPIAAHVYAPLTPFEKAA